jgi:hypothetical protein
MMAQKLASGGHEEAILMVATAIAAADLNRAWRVLEPIKSPPYMDRFRAHLAVAACLHDLDEALSLATKLKSAASVDGVLTRIACRLAPTRPTDAIRVAEMIAKDLQDAEAAVRKALALGWVAVAIAPRDKPLACSLIDRAFVAVRTSKVVESPVGANGGWPARVALLAFQAERIGYPDMESVVYRVLACRPPREREPSAEQGAKHLQAEVLMALVVALVDREVARNLLESIEKHYPTAASGWNRGDHASWLKAWLLVDPHRGQALFDEACAAVRNKPGADGDFHEVVNAATLLAVPWREKPQYIWPYSDFRPPEED